MEDESESILRVRFSHALIEVSDRLAADFPEWPMATIYEVVGESREVAERQLPNFTAYRNALEREGRIRLSLRSAPFHPEISTGTSVPDVRQW